MKKNSFVMLKLGILLMISFFAIIPKSANAEPSSYSYVVTNLEPTSCPFESDYTPSNLTSPGDNVTILGAAFGNRSVDDSAQENLYVPLNGALKNIYRGQRDEGGPIYFGLHSWNDNSIEIEVAEGQGGLLGSYIILQTYPGTRPDANGSLSQSDCSQGTLSIACDSVSYSDWGACQTDGTQTRTITNSSPNECSVVDAVLTQSCTYTPPPQECGTNSVPTENGSCICQDGYVWDSDAPDDLNCIIDLVVEPIAADPIIESISPDVLIPGETIITIKGSGFGNAYSSSNNQICFGTSCIVDSYVDDYLQSWSDTIITIRVPGFVTETLGTIGLQLYNPRLGYYEFVDSLAYTVVERPLIELYYPEMKQGETYLFSGYNFGSNKGKVIINGVEAEISYWSDEGVEFLVPSNALSGEIYIENSEGIRSQALNVSIVIVKKYSNDEYSSHQWYLENLNIDEAWEITEGSSEVIVAIIDSGVDINHEDLQHAIWKNKNEISNNKIDDDNNGYIDDIYGWNFVLNSNSTDINSDHGTMVASVIAAKKDNGIGIAGVAPNVKIMSLNASTVDDGTKIDIDAAMQAIKYAVDNGADIINLSFGGPDFSEHYEEVIRYAYDNNVLVVAATGNEYLDLSSNNGYGPVCTDLENNAIIGVAALTKDNLKSSFSNYGPVCVDLAAPGEEITVAIPSISDPDIPYTISQGTSFSAPLVAGIAALVKSEHPTWNIEEIKKVVLDTAGSLYYLDLLFGDQLGSGIPNASAALRASKPIVSYAYNPRTNLTVQQTNLVISIEDPETTPIEEPEPIKNDAIDEKNDSIDENQVDKTENSFPDIEEHKNKQAIMYLENIGIINGYPDGTFKPDNYVNRAELLKIIVEGKQLDVISPKYTNCFKDVKEEWFAPYVCYAKSVGWVQGYYDGTFEPAQTVNKVEALKMLLNAYGYISTDDIPDTGKPYVDVNVTDWFAPFVTKAKQLGILEEIGSIFSPNDGMTRGSISENLYRLLTL